MAILEGVTPPGMEDVVRRLKENPDIDNPWAVAWSIFQKQGGQAKAYSDQELAECVKRFHADREAGTLLAVYEHAAAGEMSSQAVLMSPPGTFRLA